MANERVGSNLKKILWQRFGSPDHPAEWDGRVYGGGKLSQRFWEYFKAVELLDLHTDAVVLDIGGGSPATGLGFFSSILAQGAKGVVIMDPEVGQARCDDPSVTLIPRYAS
jgi:hypothetical protein